jgi:hypothetical protein
MYIAKSDEALAVEYTVYEVDIYSASMKLRRCSGRLTVYYKSFCILQSAPVKSKLKTPDNA